MSPLKWWLVTDKDDGSILTYREVQETTRRNHAIYLYCETQNGQIFHSDYSAEIDKTGTVHIDLKDEKIGLLPNNQVDLDTCQEVTDYWFTEKGEIVPKNNLSFGKKVNLELRGTLVQHYGPLQEHKQISSDRPIRVNRVFAIDNDEHCLLAISNTTDVKEWYIVERPADHNMITADLAQKWQRSHVV